MHEAGQTLACPFVGERDEARGSRSANDGASPLGRAARAQTLIKS